MSSHPDRRIRGFTLIEISIVIALIGFMLGGVVMTVDVQRRQQQETEVRRTLADIREALIGFAASRPEGVPYLPCPDTTGDGVENRGSVNCAQAEGRLPWASLGLGDSDSWGNRFRYRVSPEFSANGGFGLSAMGVLRVCLRSGCASGELLAERIPAVVVSHGRNGWGAWRVGGGSAPAPSSSDELENADGSDDFVSREHSDAGGALGEFDDRLVWLSPHVLKHRMLQLGRLPEAF